MTHDRCVTTPPHAACLRSDRTFLSESLSRKVLHNERKTEFPQRKERKSPFVTYVSTRTERESYGKHEFIFNTSVLNISAPADWNTEYQYDRGSMITMGVLEVSGTSSCTSTSDFLEINVKLEELPFRKTARSPSTGQRLTFKCKITSNRELCSLRGFHFKMWWLINWCFLMLMITCGWILHPVHWKINKALYTH